MSTLLPMGARAGLHLETFADEVPMGARAGMYFYEFPPDVTPTGRVQTDATSTVERVQED